MLNADKNAKKLELPWVGMLIDTVTLENISAVFSKNETSWTRYYVYNPSYLEGRDQEDYDLRLPQAKSL
jgi:hypothetical protein